MSLTSRQAGFYKAKGDTRKYRGAKLRYALAVKRQHAAIRKMEAIQKPISSFFTRWKSNPSSADGTAARELMLFIVNDGDLYRQQTQPILKNLRKKIAKGTYDSTKAIKLWGYLANSGAQKYTKEFGGMYGKSSGNGSYGAFSAATRRDVAKELQEYYQEELASNNPRRRRNNPRGMRDLTETTFKIGQNTVFISQWRNAAATAFITVTTGGPIGVKMWEAKSQGPSSGGYSKPTQAAENVYKKITGEYASFGGYGDETLKKIAAAAVKARSNPRRRSKRRK